MESSLTELQHGGTRRLMNVVFAVPIFLGAFLLFQVQPLIGKFILPWFGGATGVWTTCLLFFQIVLLAGYAYAHALTRLKRPHWQVIIHLVVVAAALFFLPIIPSERWKPTDTSDPTWRILGLLLAYLGAPYFVLSSTSPLIQAWFFRALPGRSPYRLYALSNAGSLFALISFPFLFEPLFARKLLASLWSWGFAAFAVTIGFCAAWVWRKPVAASHTEAGGGASNVMWILLPAAAST